VDTATDPTTDTMSEPNNNVNTTAVQPTSAPYPNATQGEASKLAPPTTAVEQAQKTKGALTMFAPSTNADVSVSVS